MNEPCICPCCLEKINPDSDSQPCRNCGSSTNTTTSDHHHFSKGYGYYDLLSKTQICTLLSEIDHYGYDIALTRFLKTDPNLHSILFDGMKADGIYRGVGIERNSCLEIGSGLGTMTELLSHLFKQVYSLENVNEYIRFQKYRFLNSKINNISILQTDGLLLPFKDNFFDFVVCSNGFDWLEKYHHNNTTIKTQILFLSELKRVLSERGCIFLGFRNRNGLNLVSGSKNFKELPYRLSLIPQFLKPKHSSLSKSGKSDFFSTSIFKLVNNNTHYTFRKYLGLLNSQGFYSEALWAFPSHNQPYYTAEILSSYSFKGLCKFIRSTFPKFYSLKLKYKIIFGLVDALPAWMIRFMVNNFAPSYIFYCFKNQGISTLDTIIKSETGLKDFITISDGCNLKYVACDSRGEATKIIHLKRNFEKYPDRVTYYGTQNPGKHAKALNEVIWCSDWIPGNEIDPSNCEHIELSLRWLVDFQNKTKSYKMTDEFIDREINLMFSYIEKIDEIDQNACSKIIQNYKLLLLNNRIEVTEEHGDFWYGNIVIKNKEISVIDWELCRKNGDPFFDFTFFMINVYLYKGVSIRDILQGVSVVPGVEIMQTIIKDHFKFTPNMKTIIPYVILRFIIRKRLQIGRHDVDWLKYSDVMGIIK